MSKQKSSGRIKKFFLVICIIVIAGFLMPQQFSMPVTGSTVKSYAQNSFWFYPWGKSVTHKGVDIFGGKRTAITSATPGIVLFTGQISMGGNTVMVLGPKWRIHYYAHLDSIHTRQFSLVSRNTKIGTVGNTGNAIGKPPHLHYTITTLIPYPWLMDKSKQGWKKMFYLNPVPYLNEAANVKHR